MVSLKCISIAILFVVILPSCFWFHRLVPAPLEGARLVSSGVCSIPKTPPETQTNTRIAILSSYLPTRCGIATFAMETRRGILEACGNCNVSIIQVVSVKDWDLRPFPEVVFRVRKGESADYALAAKKANEFDLVIVEHEFGIFGGSHGSFVLIFLRLCQVPSVAVLHTIKYYSVPRQVTIVQEMCRLTRWHVTLQERGCEQPALRSYNQHAVDKCRWIPHGVPPPLTCNREAAKAVLVSRFGWNPNDFIVYTGGLLQPNKGISEVIVLAARVNGCRGHVRVVVTGVFHNAEYRNELINFSDSLGLNNSVKFIDRFLSQHELLVTIRSCDVTALLYKDMSQASSGVLAMSLGQGTPVMATPFSQAQSFKGGGVILVNESSVSNELVNLCSHHALLHTLRNQAEIITKNRTWRTVGVILLGMTGLDSHPMEGFSPNIFSPVAALSADRFEPPHVVKGDLLNIWMTSVSVFLVDPHGMQEIPLAGDFLLFNGKAYRLWEENHAAFITRIVFQEGCCWQERIWDADVMVGTVEKCVKRENKFFRWSLRVVDTPHLALSGLVAGVDDLSLVAREGTPVQVRISHMVGRNTTLVEIAIEEILVSLHYASFHEVSLNLFEGQPHYVAAKCAVPDFEALIHVSRQRVSLPPGWNLMRFLCISASSRNWCFSGEFVRFHSIVDARISEETMRIWDGDLGHYHDAEMRCVEGTMHYRTKPVLRVRKCVTTDGRGISVNVSATALTSGITVVELILGMDNLDEAQINGNPCYAGVCQLALFGNNVSLRFPFECQMRAHVNGAQHLHYLEARCAGNSVNHHVSWR